jgi:hypothetical protein
LLNVLLQIANKLGPSNKKKIAFSTEVEETSLGEEANQNSEWKSESREMGMQSRMQRVLTILYNTQNHWVYRLGPLSEILNN